MTEAAIWLANRWDWQWITWKIHTKCLNSGEDSDIFTLDHVKSRFLRLGIPQMVRLRMIYAWVFHIITELNGYGVWMNLIDIYIYTASVWWRFRAGMNQTLAYSSIRQWWHTNFGIHGTRNMFRSIFRDNFLTHNYIYVCTRTSSKVKLRHPKTSCVNYYLDGCVYIHIYTVFLGFRIFPHPCMYIYILISIDIEMMQTLNMVTQLTI
jgi:hypothetical protein